MTTNLSALKAHIVGLAAQGRHIRQQANKTSGTAKHELKQRAKVVGLDARDALIAYALLRGKDLSKCESPNTVTAPGINPVSMLALRYYTDAEQAEGESWKAYFERKATERKAFEAKVTATLTAYAQSIESRKVEKLKEAA